MMSCNLFVAMEIKVIYLITTTPSLDKLTHRL